MGVFVSKRGRPPKQAAPDLKALEHIPAVRDALRFVGLELLIRPLSYVTAPPLTPADIQRASEQPMQRMESVVLDTPERREWLQQQADVNEAYKAEKARQAPKPPAQLPAAQRKAIEAGFMVEANMRRAEKLAQFAHDDAAGEDTTPLAVETVAIETLSEAT